MMTVYLTSGAPMDFDAAVKCEPKQNVEGRTEWVYLLDQEGKTVGIVAMGHFTAIVWREPHTKLRAA